MEEKMSNKVLKTAREGEFDGRGSLWLIAQDLRGDQGDLKRSLILKGQKGIPGNFTPLQAVHQLLPLITLKIFQTHIRYYFPLRVFIRNSKRQHKKVVTHVREVDDKKIGKCIYW